MTDNGPEPILVQVKQSIRLAPDLDAQVEDLAALEAGLGLTVADRWVNPQAFIELVRFPADFTEDQIAAAVQTLFESPAVDQVVAIWGSFLIYRGFEFASGEFGPNDPIPEVVLRGLDTPPPAPVDSSVLSAEHVPNQLVVTWKPEFVWNAAQTGFLETISQFNAGAGCRVLNETASPPADLTQVLEFDPEKISLLDELIHYTNSGLVSSAQPNFIYCATIDVGNTVSPAVIPTRKHAHRARHKLRAARSEPLEQ